jgi:LysR family transcriptional activator of mexEF-oprN operon
VLVTFAGDLTDYIDERLKAKAVECDVVLSVPAFSVLPFVLQGTDLIATVSEHAANAVAGDYDTVRTSALPFKTPKFDASIAWRLTTYRDPAEELLRRIIVEEMRGRFRAPVDGE